MDLSARIEVNDEPKIVGGPGDVTERDDAHTPLVQSCQFLEHHISVQVCTLLSGGVKNKNVAAGTPTEQLARGKILHLSLV
jgi:hypothetical protein